MQVLRTESPVLEVSELAYATQEGKLLAKGISFQLHLGETLLVGGANGAGKSTLLRVLVGQHRPLKGTLTHRLPASSIAYIPQLQNTEFHLPLCLGDLLPTTDISAISEWGLLEPSQLALAWNTASGGERKRALLTRALLQHCSVLILDEPFNHLDRESKIQIQKALSRFIAAGDKSLIVVSHDVPPDWQRLKSIRLGDDEC
ncbi:MAG: ATP-binding cassette domain-containing protein [Bdellovibrionales bacterium]|nr:ATP-binding cassette domain-containing protein [Bdellovibrionales bacterium]